MDFAERNIEGLVGELERFGVMDFEATGREMMRQGDSERMLEADQ